MLLKCPKFTITQVIVLLVSLVVIGVTVGIIVYFGVRDDGSDTPVTTSATTAATTTEATTTLPPEPPEEGTTTPTPVTPPDATTVIDTAQGPLRGSNRYTLNNIQYASFERVPFAKPPVGELRFRDPVPADPWVDERDATYGGVLCTQQIAGIQTTFGQEDCLVLNIYTPNIQPESLLPVMVHIPGGGYVMSTTTFANNPELFIEQGVILVIVNYRLGPLGFLSLGTEDVPGNAGMKDQVLALRWLKQNIAAFGGDGENLTVFGESAGGSSVSLLQVSPMSRTLMNKAIQTSGTSLCDWVLQSNATAQAESFINNLGFGLGDHNVLQLLQDASLEDIIAASPEISIDGISNLGFTPVIEDQFPEVQPFLIEHPEELLTNGEYAHIPTIIGYDSFESVSFYNEESFRELLQTPSMLVPRHLGIENDEILLNDVAQKILDYFLQGQPWNPEQKDSLISVLNLMSDLTLITRIEDTVRLLLETSDSPVYYFRNSYRGKTLGQDREIIDQLGIQGAGHADHLSYLFPHEPVRVDERSSDGWTRGRVIGMYTNFAKTGTPTPGPESQLFPVIWPRVSTDKLEYLEINGDMTISTYPDGERSEFWRELKNYANAMKMLTVVVEQGPLRGEYRNTLNNVTYASFESIPFAKPPIGELRFKDPVPADPWVDERDATNGGVLCIQQIAGIPTLGQEDCLVLNIYTPNIQPESLLPVMVHIPGGAYVMSTTTYANNPELFIEQGVILVIVNYRLGPLGFLSLGTEDVPGNAGMKDQVLALRWLKQNIAAFGGDGENLTVFGESAGGSSVSLLQVSPMSRTLMNKAIQTSGTSLCYWVLQSNATAQAESLVNKLGFGLGDDNLLQLLQDASLEDIIDATPEVSVDGIFELSFNPVIEEQFPEVEPFLIENPEELLTNGEYAHIPTIIGYDSFESVSFYNEESLRELLQTPSLLVPRHLGIENDEILLDDVGQKILDYFLQGQPWNPEEKDSLISVLNLMSDLIFITRVEDTVRLLLETSDSPVYYYRNSYRGKTLGQDREIIDQLGIQGAGHADHLSYLFPHEPERVDERSSDGWTRGRVIGMYTNFAKTGTPTPGPESQLFPVIWPRVSTDKLEYLELNGDMTISTYPDGERSEFWRELKNYANAMKMLTVVVEQGPLRGEYRNTLNNVTYASFESIPFAKPPIGELRFKDPVPADPWIGERDATYGGVLCTQLIAGIPTLGQEDCLVLNIYTPNIQPESLLPVMVHIPGGGYVMSTTTFANNPELFIEQGVILVIVNHRLGPLGFLSLGTADVPGNAGMKDQVLALRWLKQNIAAFGGDGENLTAFGESAGGSSVSLLQVSPMSRTLMNKAIQTSGTSLCNWVLQSNATAQAESFVNNLGFGLGDDNLLQLLQEASLEDIIGASPETSIDGILNFGFTPVIEEQFPYVQPFLIEHPEELLTNGEYAHIPTMIGYDSFESVSFYNEESLRELLQTPSMLVPRHLGIENDEILLDDVGQKILDYFLQGQPWNPEEKDSLISVLNLISDLMFITRVEDTVRLLLETSVSPVYYYRNSYRGKTIGLNHEIIEQLGIQGAGHADHLSYLFPHEPVRIDERSSDGYIRGRVIGMYTNFAKTGTPTPGPESQLFPVIWPRVSTDALEYLEINGDMTISTYPDRERSEFWRDLKDYANTMKMLLTVAVEQGPLRGEYRKTLNNVNYASFESIPFAKPPLGELRFKKSHSWPGISAASDHLGSGDCQ